MTGGAPHTLSVTLADGCRLLADHYPVPGPDTTGRARGTVLLRTPYGRARHRAQAASWNRAGFDVVVQDVRGRYGSEGEWRPYRSEGDDGAATVRSLASQGVLRGRVLLAGASYDAHCALEAARTLELGDPGEAVPGRSEPAVAVVAMVPALGLFETAHDPQGRPRLRDRIGWWHQHGFARESGPPLPDDELDRLCDQARRHGVLSVVEDGVHGPGASAAWRRLWAASPLDLTARYGSLRTPLLVIGGSRDFFAAETLRLAGAWGQGRTELLWGPWGHRLAADLEPRRQAALRAAGGLLHRISSWSEAPPEHARTWAFDSRDTGSQDLAGPAGPAWRPAARDELPATPSSSPFHRPQQRARKQRARTP